MLSYIKSYNHMGLPRIAILADFPWTYFDHGAQGRGGGQSSTWLVQLAEAYQEYSSEFEIHWLSIDRSRWSGGMRTRDSIGQRFHQFPGIRASLDVRLRYMPSYLYLSNALRTIQPDILHTWGTERSYPIMNGWSGIPTILSMQGILTEYMRIGSFSGNGFWEKVSAWEPRFLKSANIVTVESQWGMQTIRRDVDGLDIRQVEYGVHPSFYNVNWEPDLINPYALYVGSIDTRKGVDVLMEAANSLRNRPWKLRIAGDGPLREHFQQQCIHNVDWLGLQSWSELQQQLAHALCLVLPTRADTSPNVVKEARVIGLPVITTLHGGQAEYIQDGVNGVIVNPLEPMLLARSLDSVMSDPEKAIAMGARRHLQDRGYFRPEETARRFTNIYRELTVM